MTEQLTFDEASAAREVRAVEFGKTEALPEDAPVAQLDAEYLASLIAIPIEDIAHFFDEVHKQHGLDRPHVTAKDVKTVQRMLEVMFEMEARYMEGVSA